MTAIQYKEIWNKCLNKIFAVARVVVTDNRWLPEQMNKETFATKQKQMSLKQNDCTYTGIMGSNGTF